MKAGSASIDLAGRPLGWLAVVLLALALTGCGQLPRPFKPETKGDNQLLILPDRTGVAVGSVTGDLPDGQAMAEAMAEALRQENVPATVAIGNRQVNWLLGAAEVTARGQGRVTRRLVWEMYDPQGAPVTTVTRSVTLPPGGWRDAETLQRAAAEAAPELAAALQGPAPETGGLPGFPDGTEIAIGEVTGRPLELARALTGAMAAQLRQRGLPLSDRPSPGDVVLNGQVLTQQRAGATGQRLQVTWTVTRQGESQPLGDLTQANAVRQTELDAPERLAQTIAGAAVPGVLQVLREARR
jgi:hypothetical protein